MSNHQLHAELAFSMVCRFLVLLFALVLLARVVVTALENWDARSRAAAGVAPAAVPVEVRR